MSNSKVDRYHGVGGSYVVDPKSSERVRVAGPALENNVAATSKPAAARARTKPKSTGTRAAQPAAKPDATSSDAGAAAQSKE